MANEGKILLLSFLFLLFAIVIFSHQEKTEVAIDYPYAWSGLQVMYEKMNNNTPTLFVTEYRCPTKYEEKTIMFPPNKRPFSIDKLYISTSGVWLYFSNGLAKKTWFYCSSPKISIKFDNILYVVIGTKSYIPYSKKENGNTMTVYLQGDPKTTIIFEDITITSKIIHT